MSEAEYAWGTYSRNRVRHSVLMTVRDRGESLQYVCEWLVVAEDFRIGKRADVGAALSALYDVIAEEGDWHAHSEFSTDATPRLAITLSVPSVVPFNHFLGYRAALVEDDRMAWSVIIDRPSAESDEHQVSITLFPDPAAREVSYRDLLARCVAIRDSVMIEGGYG